MDIKNDTIANLYKLEDLIKPSPRFQRAIHLRYDLGDKLAIERYIPTQSAVDALGKIFYGANPNATQRSHVLHAAYGSGKSLLAVVIAALAQKEAVLAKANQRLLEKLQQFGDHSDVVLNDYFLGETRLLPVVLSGDEGNFSTAMSRALVRALKETEIYQIELQTRYEDVLNVIARWENQFPETIERFESLLSQHHNSTLDDIKNALAEHNPAAFEIFERIYPQITSGVKFDQFSFQNPDVIYRNVASQLYRFGYKGIMVLWDEFGRYLEGRTIEVFGQEAELLQSFAEMCNYSGDEQIHLLLFAHKELQSYASSLPKVYQQEWSRIEGRFQKHNISGDPYIAYKLIANAIEQTNSNIIYDILANEIDYLVTQTIDAHLFGLLTSEDVRQLIHETYPLHPLTVFCLARLSNQVAQNERTMFTFLTVDEAKALHGIIQRVDLNDEEAFFVRPAVLWDYFEDSIRADTGVGGTHKIWSGVVQALGKVSENDEISHLLIKTIGVLSICSLSSIARPTTEFLCWALGAETEEQITAIVATLDNLRRRKVLINRQVDGYWTFTIGSDIDFEKQIAEVIERTNPTNLQLRRLLEDTIFPPYTLARRYNQERAIIRYFTGIYRWSEEIADISWDALIRKLDNPDGIVVYVLAHDELSLRSAIEAIRPHPQIIYVIPNKPLLALKDVLRELYGLHELNNDPHLKQQDDPKRIQIEMDWLIEDSRTRLQKEIDVLIEPRRGESRWFAIRDEKLIPFNLSSPGQATSIVSHLCENLFPRTPVFNSEGLNRQKPTSQQINATEKAIDAILSHEVADKNFGLVGNAPEVAAIGGVLRLPGILQSDDNENWYITKPDDSSNPLLAEVWDLIETYLKTCINEPQTAKKLIDNLTAAPYGIRLGVIPLIFAAVLKKFLKVATIRRDKKTVHPVTGSLIIDLVKNADHYTIELGEWDESLEKLWQALLNRFSNYIHENERNQQPLTILRLAFTRWLQSLPTFCRDTQKLSPFAISLRNLVRKLQLEPGEVLFNDLPHLLEVDEFTSQEEIESLLNALTNEIENSYLELQRRLDLFVIDQFSLSGATALNDGQKVLQTWLHEIQSRHDKQILELRFGSTMTQQFINTIAYNNGTGQFWDSLSNAIIGIHLRDWNDKSEEKFYSTLQNCRSEVEREFDELLQEETVVAISVQLPNIEQNNFRFRASDLSPHGKRLLQNFKSQMEIAGRPLSVDEKRQIAIAFLYYVMGEEINE